MRFTILVGVAAAIAAAVVGCDARGPTCSTRDDCSGALCANVVSEAYYGFHDNCIDIQGEHPRCVANADCAFGQVCDMVAVRCAESHTECVPRCSSSTQCAGGEECNDGRCEAIPCQSGRYSCPDGSRCSGIAADPLTVDPLDVPAAHGCVFQACRTRADCTGDGDWWCIDDTCQDLPGVCL